MGKFDLDQSISLNDLNAETAKLLPIEEAVSHLPDFVLSDDRVEKTRNGMTTRANGNQYVDNEIVRMVDQNGNLIAIGVNETEISEIRPKIVLA